MKKQTKRTRGNTQTYSIEDITGFSRRDEGRKINNHLIETYLQQVRDYPYTVERFVRYLSGLAAITIMLKKDFEKLDFTDTGLNQDEKDLIRRDIEKACVCYDSARSELNESPLRTAALIRTKRASPRKW